MKPRSERILVVEDDQPIAAGLSLNLRLEGYQVAVADNAEAGHSLWLSFKPDLVVLDIMLPGRDGLTLLRRIRKKDRGIPVLILSAKSDTRDRVKGLACGGDDYLSKPFDLEEFLLRVKGLLRRSRWSRQDPIYGNLPPVVCRYRFGCNTIDFERHLADTCRGTIRLTVQEVRLLKLFVANAGKPLARRHILKIGWGVSSLVDSRTVDAFMVRLRRYFEADPKHPVFFKSIRSLGYLFDPDADS